METWLPCELEGADGVRREIALRLAAELDEPGIPAHVIPRAANALAGIVAAIETDDDDVPGAMDAKTLRALLHEAVR